MVLLRRNVEAKDLLQKKDGTCLHKSPPSDCSITFSVVFWTCLIEVLCANVSYKGFVCILCQLPGLLSSCRTFMEFSRWAVLANSLASCKSVHHHFAIGTWRQPEVASREPAAVSKARCKGEVSSSQPSVPTSCVDHSRGASSSNWLLASIHPNKIGFESHARRKHHTTQEQKPHVRLIAFSEASWIIWICVNDFN